LSGYMVMKFKESHFRSERDGTVRKHQFICDEQMATDFTEDSVSRTTFRVVTFLTTTKKQAQIQLQLLKSCAKTQQTPIWPRTKFMPPVTAICVWPPTIATSRGMKTSRRV
jgi:hypothetical protein